MNTFYSKPVIVVFAAFTAGGVAGFFVAKKLLEQHYQEQAQIDIDDVKAYYREKYEGKETVSKYQNLTERYKKPDLHLLASSHNVVEEELEDEEEELEEEDEEEEELEEETPPIVLDPNKDPYLISYDEFVRETDIFDKTELYYYRFDDVICNSEDAKMLEPEDTLGWEWMHELETKTTAFVRNEKLATDFEIHSFSKSYAEEVAARRETDKEKKYRRLARKKEAMDSSSTEILDFKNDPESKTIKKKTPYVRKPKKDIEEAEE